MVEKQPKFLTDKRDIASKFGSKDIMNKKPLKNPKYESVKSTVNTGKTIKNVTMQSDQMISKRRSELFKRVKGGAIVKLLTETKESMQESIYNLGNEENQVKVYIILLRMTKKAISVKINLLYQSNRKPILK